VTFLFEHAYIAEQQQNMGENYRTKLSYLEEKVWPTVRRCSPVAGRTRDTSKF